MKKKIIIALSTLLVAMSITVFVFAYYNFFASKKGSEIVLENVKFQVNDSPNKGEEDVVYFTTDELTEGDGYQVNLKYSLNGTFVSNYAMKYSTYFEVEDESGISNAIDVYRFYDGSFHFVGNLNSLLYSESDSEPISVYTDFLGTSGSHLEKFILVYSLGSKIEDKSSFSLKISTKSEMVTTTASEFPYFYLNDMGGSDDSQMAETAESIFKQLPDNELIYGRTIVLMKDLVYTTKTDITFNNLVGLDLNGHKIDLHGGTLTFKDTNETGTNNYNKSLSISDNVGGGFLKDSTIAINYSKSVIDIQNDFYTNSSKLNNSNINITSIGLNAFENASSQKFEEITDIKHTVTNGNYSFDLFGDLKFYLLKGYLSINNDGVSVLSSRGEAELNIDSNYIFNISGINSSDSISLTIPVSDSTSKVTINDILQLYGSTTDSCVEYLMSYVPKRLDGSIYLPSYISIFNAYITWISYDENLINNTGRVLPNGYFNLDSWVSKKTNLGFIIDQSGDVLSGVIKDIEIVVLSPEERAELLFDAISVTFNGDDVTSYSFDLVNSLFNKYDSNDLAAIASEYFNITLDSSKTFDEQKEDFIAELKVKLGLDHITVSSEQEPQFVKEGHDSSLQPLLSGVTDLTQDGTPNEIVSLVYSINYTFADAIVVKYKLFNINTGEAEVTLVDVTNSLRVPFDIYSEHITGYTMDGDYRIYNKYVNNFQLVSSFDGITIDYTVPNEYRNYVKIETNQQGQKILTITRDNVPADTHTVTIVARISGVDSPIYLPFTCVGVLHGTTSRNHAEFENGNLYTIMLNNYDKNNDLTLTDLEAKNSPITSISVNKRRLDSLVGLKYFDKLTSVSFTECNLTNIKDLAYLKELTYVNLNTNNVANLEPFRYLDKLKTLYLGNNQVSSIEPIQYLTNLEKLNVANNSISDFRYIENLTGLTELWVANNKISGGQLVVDLNNAASAGDYAYIIRGNQYYFNLLSQKRDQAIKIYIAADGTAYSFNSDAKKESEILSNITPIYHTSDVMVVPTFIVINGVEYEITYETTLNNRNYVVISRNSNLSLTNISLNQIPVDNNVVIYAYVNGLAEDDDHFYRPLNFAIRKGSKNTNNYGKIEVSSGHWMLAEDVVKDVNLLSKLWVLYDQDNDGAITFEELQHTGNTVEVNVESAGVESLSGIQYFGNITSLNIRNNILELNEKGTAKIDYISYLSSLEQLRMNGQKFDFDDLIYYTRLKENGNFNVKTTGSFELKDINNNEFTVNFDNVGLTTLKYFYVYGSNDLSDYETKTQLYHVYMNNPSIKLYKDSTSEWDPINEEINKLLGSMTTSAKFINYNDEVQIKKEYKFYMYDDLYPTTFNLTNESAISDNEYLFAGGSTGNRPSDDAYINVIDALDYDPVYELSQVDTGFIAKANHKLADYFKVETDTVDIKITYKKLIYKDYQAYLGMKLATNSICDGRRSLTRSSSYNMTLFMQYNNDYTFIDDQGIDDSVDGQPINAVFGAVESMLLVMNGVTEQLKAGTRGYNYLVTKDDGTVENNVIGTPNYLVKSSEVKTFNGEYTKLDNTKTTACDFNKYFFIHGNFMPTAKSAVDGLRYLTQIKKLYIRRDAVLGTGIDLRNIEELFAVYTYFDISDFKYVCENTKIIILAQATATNLSDETSLDSDPNQLVETYMVYFPNLNEFYFRGEGDGEKGQMYEWSAFLAYSYIPYNQIYKKDSQGNYVYYHEDGSKQYVGGVELDSLRRYYWYDSSARDYHNFKYVYYSFDGSTFNILNQDIIDDNSNIFDDEDGSYKYLYEEQSGNKISASNQIFGKVARGYLENNSYKNVKLNNFKISRTVKDTLKYTNTYENQLVLMELYRNLPERTVPHFYINNTSPADGDGGDFDPTFSAIVFNTNVTNEYNELAPSISDFHVKLSGSTFDGTSLNDTEYSKLSWVDSDYSDYFRKGLTVKLPINYNDYKIGYTPFDEKYRNFTINWYVAFAIDSTGADSNDYNSVQLNDINTLITTTTSAFSVSISGGYVVITLNYSGYYMFEGLLGLSCYEEITDDNVKAESGITYYEYNGSNYVQATGIVVGQTVVTGMYLYSSYAYNTKYSTKPSSVAGNNQSFTYSYNISGSVSILYPITITSMSNSEIDALQSSRKKSMTLISNDTITVNYSSNSITNTTYNLKWYDTIIDRSFKFVVFESFAKNGLSQSASEMTIDLMYDDTNPSILSSDRLKLYDKILNRLYGLSTQNETDFNISDLTNGLDKDNNSKYDIKTFYGLQRFLSDIYTLDGWETLSINTFKYKYASTITYLPNRFPYQLENLYLSSTYGITYFGALFESNVIDARLSYGSTGNSDAGVVDYDNHTGNTDKIQQLVYQSDTVIDLYDYADLVNKINNDSSITLNLSTLYVNSITEDSFKLLADLSKKLTNNLTIYMYSGIADKYTLSFHDESIVQYFCSNVDISKLSIILYDGNNDNNIDLIDNLKKLLVEANKIEAPTQIKKGTFFSKTSNLSSNNYSVIVPVTEGHKKDNTVAPENSDFYPDFTIGKDVTYNVAIRYTSNNRKIQVFKKITGNSETDAAKHYGLKIGVFKDGIRTGLTTPSYTVDQLDIYDTSHFDYNYVNYLIWLLKNSDANNNLNDTIAKSFVTAITVNGYSVNVAKGPQTFQYRLGFTNNDSTYHLGEDNSPDYTYPEGITYIYDKHLLVDNAGAGNKYYLIIVNTEYFSFEYFSTGNIQSPSSEHYNTIDVKGFELLPYKAIIEGNAINSKGSLLTINKIINSDVTHLESNKVKLQYIEINNLPYGDDFGVTSSEGAEAYISMYTTLTDFSGLAESVLNNTTLILGNRSRILQRFIEYRAVGNYRGIFLKNDLEKDIYVNMEYPKMHLLFNNGDYEKSFNYQLLKQDILNATIGSSDVVFFKNYNDFYTPVYYQLVNFAGGELTNITLYNNVENHPFNSANRGVLQDDSVYNYYLSDKSGSNNSARILYSSEFYDPLKLFGEIINVHSNNIREMSNKEKLSMYNTSFTISDFDEINNMVFTLSSTNTLELPKKINNKNVIYLPVDTYHVYKEQMVWKADRSGRTFRTSSKTDAYGFQNISFINWTYFDQIQGFVAPKDILGTFKNNYFDMFEIQVTNNSYIIKLKDNVTTNYTALRYKFYAFEIRKTPSNGTSTTIYNFYHDYVKFTQTENYDYSFSVNKSVDWKLAEFYVDINANNTIGRQIITNSYSLHLPKQLNLGGTLYYVTYSSPNDTIEFIDNGTYYSLELKDNAIDDVNIMVQATLNTQQNSSYKYSTDAKKYSDFTVAEKQMGAYERVLYEGEYLYRQVQSPNDDTEYYYKISTVYQIVDFYVNTAPGDAKNYSEEYSVISGDYYVEVLVDSSTEEVIPAAFYIETTEVGNSISSSYIIGDYISDLNGTPNTGYKWKIVNANTIFDSGLLLTDMFYGGTISIGESQFEIHDKVTDTNVNYFPQYVVMDYNGNFILSDGDIITYNYSDLDSGISFIESNNDYHLGLIYTKEKIKNIHYFSNTQREGDGGIGFRAQSVLNGLEIFPLTHVRFGYWVGNGYGYGSDAINGSNSRAFPGNNFECFKDMKLVEFDLVFKHTSIFVSDWTFLFNSRNSLEYFRYGGLLTSQAETSPTTHDDFSFLLSFPNLKDIRIFGLTGIEKTQSFRYFISLMSLLHNGENIVHYYTSANIESSSEYANIYVDIPADLNAAVTILQGFDTTDQSDFNYQNGYELYLGDNSSYYSNVSNYDDTDATQYLLPSYINDSGTYYKLTYESLSNFANIVVIDKLGNELTMLQYQALYAEYVYDCLENNIEVDDYEFTKDYQIYVRFNNLINCLTDRIMISMKIESQSKMLSKPSILEIDNSSSESKTNYINGTGYPDTYYDGNTYIYTPYSYERFLSIYVDHTSDAYLN